jgi:hypothetical protein
METNNIAIKKQHGEYNVYRIDESGWPNYMGKSRTLAGARAIADRKLTIREKYNWGACGNGCGMAA